MITAIIPCYNAEAHLGEALASVQEQTRSVDELIVVDDCSSDGSVAIATEYGARVLSTLENSGHASARNLAIEHATGDIIVWLDADDLWKPQHVETVVGLLERFPEAAVAYSGIQTFGNANWKWTSFPCENQPRQLVDECFDHTIVPAMSAATRREAMQSVGGFDTSIRISPDFDLWLRLASKTKFVCTSQITALYRIHESQISQSQHLQMKSCYRTRLQFINNLANAGEDARANHLKQKLVSRFEADLLRCWHRRDSRSYRMLLAMAAEIPQGKTIARKMGLRRFVPGQMMKYLSKPLHKT